MLQSIRINSHSKLEKITEELKSQGRGTHYEKFYDYEGSYYLLFYAPKRFNPGYFKNFKNTKTFT